LWCIDVQLVWTVEADVDLAQLSVNNCFIRGSVVRYVRMSARSVDTTLLEDATRRGTFSWNATGCEVMGGKTAKGNGRECTEGNATDAVTEAKEGRK
jgi:hypothetical protein